MSILDRWRSHRRKMSRDAFERILHEHRWDALAGYNAERSRGIVHTPEYAALMAQEQEEFNREQEIAAIRAVFDTVYQPDQWVPWLTTPAPVFGGSTAEALIESGRGDEVLAALDALASGTFT